MHLKRQKPKFQIRLLEYEKGRVTFKKKSKSSNIYPNPKNCTLEQIWEKIKEAIENA